MIECNWISLKVWESRDSRYQKNWRIVASRMPKPCPNLLDCRTDFNLLRAYKIAQHLVQQLLQLIESHQMARESFQREDENQGFKLNLRTNNSGVRVYVR